MEEKKKRKKERVRNAKSTNEENENENTRGRREKSFEVTQDTRRILKTRLVLVEDSQIIH